ncbi:MAG: hypothetical protein RL217_1500 [Pseudomonadota bacterium]|jgi:molybdopterin synthase sulfur carrier subunit
MLKVLFFARYRETLGTEQLDLPYHPDLTHLEEVRKTLAKQGGKWQVLNDTGLMCARNQELVELHTPIQDGDELAFFPTVTGG